MARPTEIYCLLVPLVDERLIIPRSCVAEVIGYQPPLEMPGAPPWYLGVTPWNGRQVPIISFEGCCGSNIPPATHRSRIVVLHTASPRVEAGCFGILSQGFPQLVRVAEEVVKPDSSRAFPARAPVLCQLRLLNESPLVPDLDRLEALVADETAVLPPG